MGKRIIELMQSIDNGTTQLPDFQRGWVWDDNRIKALIASITNGFPIGAAMFLEYGNENIRFKYRVIEGAPTPTQNITPTELILDGQQRLTSMYSALFSPNPVHTRTDKGKDIKRYYYIDIEKALNPEEDRIDAIVSIPETKIITSNFGRDVDLDISTPEKEFKNKIFPLNKILNISEWEGKYFEYHKYDPDIVKQYMSFKNSVITPVSERYEIPVIRLDKNTPKEAVCQVFENVNTGGVSLTVFELVTAIFAMEDFELRKDWKRIKENHFNSNLLSIITETDFLTACTLLSTYKESNGETASCKKKDVLNLSLAEYQKYADNLSRGFKEAEKILKEERIFSSVNLPYTTQFIPLAVLCTLLTDRNKIKTANIRDKIKKWYWCGVFGEMYGGANETRYVNDTVDVMKWVDDDNKKPRTVQESYFNPTRLLSLQSRQSAAYKGIIALILQNNCKDFISGREMDFVMHEKENIDIHHIFPKTYCEKNNYDKKFWNSVVNKTPLTYSTNREIGGVAPSKYLAKIEKNKKVNNDNLNKYVLSHLIDVSCCRDDDFYRHIINRAKMLLKAIENATGKTISGKDSEEVKNSFGESLSESEKENKQ